MSITYEWELRRSSDDVAVQSGDGESPGGDNPSPGVYYLWVKATDESGSSEAVSEVVVLAAASYVGTRPVVAQYIGSQLITVTH